MVKFYSLSKKHIVFSLFVLFAVFAIVNYEAKNQNVFVNIFNLLSSSTSSVMSIRIEPASQTLDINEEYSFTSYAQTSTGDVSIKSAWTFGDESYLAENDCATVSKICKVHIITGPGSFQINAKAEGKTAKASITVTSEAIDSDFASDSTDGASSSQPEMFIVPEKRSMNQASAYTFTSYVSYSTGTVEVDSDWILSDENLADLDSNCEKNSKCIVYSGLESAKVVLSAKFFDLSSDASVTINSNLINPFTDELPDWAKEAIISLYSRGIIKGYEDSRYGSSDEVTRGQLIVLVERLLKHLDLYDDAALTGVNCNKFNDVLSDYYAYNAICYSDELGWLDRESDVYDSYLPNDSSLRKIVARIVLKSFLEKLIEADGYDKSFISSYGTQFSDISENDPYAFDIGSVNYYKIMTGQGDGTIFSANTTLNRAELAQILYRILELL